MSGETKQRLSDLAAENALLREVVADLSRKPNMRDKFAIAALPAVIGHVRTNVEFSMIAEEAYHMADAMLEQREKKDDVKPS